jgi:drug/metabolite transporter (DMT)-like permease
VAFHRLLFALPLLWLWRGIEARKGTDIPPRSLTDFGWLALAGFCFATDLSLWHWSIRYTTVANATLFANFAPIFVTLGARLFFGEQIVGRFVAGMILALTGAALLLGFSFRFSPSHLVGDILGLVTALFYGAYMLCVSRLRRSFSVATVLAWSGLVSTPLLWMFARGAGETILPQSARGWVVVLTLAFVSQVAGQGLIAYAFAHLSASFTSLSLLLQPLVAALLAWILLDEALGPLQIFGGLVILAGIYLASRNRPRPVTGPADPQRES